MTIEEQAIEYLKTAKDILIYEGYAKEDYFVTPDRIEESQIEEDPNIKWIENVNFWRGKNDNGICGAKYCLIGSLSAATQPKTIINGIEMRPIIPTFCQHVSHENRLDWQHDDALVLAYRELNVEAEESIDDSERFDQRNGYGPAEHFAEDDLTTREDLVALIERTIVRIESLVTT